MINISLLTVTVPEFTVTCTSSVAFLVKYKKGIAIPAVALKLRIPSFQSMVTVQSEKSETVVFVAAIPVTLITIGSVSSITPDGT